MEKAILNQILVQDQTYLISKIKSVWFLDKKHRKIFDCIRTVFKNAPIDREELCKAIGAYKDILIEVDKIYKTFDFENVTISELKSNYEQYAINRKLSGITMLDLVSQKQVLFDLMQIFGEEEQSEIVKWSEVAEKEIAEYIPNKLYELNTPWEKMNDELCGFENSYTIIAGRPSYGKTDMMLNIIRHLRGHKGIFFTLEIRKEKVLRLLSSLNIDSSTAWNRREVVKDKIDKEKFTELINRIRYENLLLFDRTVDVNEIIDITLKENQRQKVKYIIVDSLKHIRFALKATRKDNVEFTTKRLCALVRDYNIAVILLHHTNLRDESEHVTHNLGHLKDSGDLEADADNVIFIEGNRDSDERTFFLAKCREGQTIRVEMEYKKHLGVFNEKY